MNGTSKWYEEEDFFFLDFMSFAFWRQCRPLPTRIDFLSSPGEAKGMFGYKSAPFHNLFNPCAF